MTSPRPEQPVEALTAEQRSLAEHITVGLIGQPNALGLTWNEAQAIAFDIARRSRAARASVALDGGLQEAVAEWFAGRCPADWTEDEHLAHWWVNCTSDEEKSLAAAYITHLESRTALRAQPAAPEPVDPRPCARYWGSDGTLCSTHNQRFSGPSEVRCAARLTDPSR